MNERTTDFNEGSLILMEGLALIDEIMHWNRVGMGYNTAEDPSKIKLGGCGGTTNME